MRDYVLTHLAESLGVDKSDKICQNLEKCILNWAVRYTSNLYEQPSWENPRFKEIYKRKFLSIQFNLKVPLNTLRDSILKGDIKVTDVVTMTPEELYPTGPFAVTKKKLHMDWLHKYALNAQEDEYEGMFKCGKCKSNKTSYFQLQTRSADEPMTTFITCKNCGNRWRC